MERHRLAHVVAETVADLDYSKVLHVAPERELSRWLRGKAGEYLSVDLHAEAMQKMDVTNLKLGECSKTLVWISHVMEHIPDDQKAISEIYRVLKPGGVAFVQVPIWRMETYEDFSAVSDQDRLNKFYQGDHVRLYGLDIMERFRRAGFNANLYRAQDFGPEKMLLNGLSFASTAEVFVFRK